MTLMYDILDVHERRLINCYNVTEIQTYRKTLHIGPIIRRLVAVKVLLGYVFVLNI